MAPNITTTTTTTVTKTTPLSKAPSLSSHVSKEQRKILVDQGCIVREIGPVYPPQNQTQFANCLKISTSKTLECPTKSQQQEGNCSSPPPSLSSRAHVTFLAGTFGMADGYFYAMMDCFCEKPWRHAPYYTVAPYLLTETVHQGIGHLSSLTGLMVISTL
ncbi:hypothetical protein Patl1_22462 [Pistacia atlantica]|uniref:Uncharacterized protein n=1 Tax=Pistacia atlantica TaxID=434234 RepID=A0ACC0ZZM0_9ROSI|nr:hypothetical protein Patl1_22462 [Pistacia atlantica]